MTKRWITESKGDLGACLGRMEQGVALRESLMEKLPREPLPYAGPLLDAVGMFEELGIGYALIEGIASMYYGRSRFTEDVDFVAIAGHQDILAAHPASMRKHHFNPESTWKLYHESGVDIDIWKDEHSDAIVARAQMVGMAGRTVRIAEPHDLIAMKLRAGRIQDDYDVSEIVAGTSVDDARIEGLVTAEQFRHYLGVKRRG
ncbi:MAG TPA: nucleotidyltransferase [Tepidisphaeraceae bacterium]|jgi:hypothetical protein|nr:nucleotidyltransferase [Tepidisphaeraceae bacterium]